MAAWFFGRNDDVTSGHDGSVLMTIFEVIAQELERLYIDADMFRELGGKYLFSRIEIGNGPELGFTLVGTYGGEGSPYTIYVYEQV